MKRGRKYWLLIVPAVLGAAGTTFFAFARCYWARWGPFDVHGSKVISDVGAGEIASGSKAWRWVSTSTFGGTICDSRVVSDTERAAFLPGNYHNLEWRPGPVPWWATASELNSIQRFTVGDYTIDAAYGWPMRCFASRMVYDKSRPMSAEMRKMIPGLKPEEEAYEPHVEHGRFWGEFTPSLQPDDQIWPTRVLWPALAANAAAGALIFASPLLLWRGFTASRERLRRRSGRCIACGFDRTGLVDTVPCPECGAAVSSR